MKIFWVYLIVGFLVLGLFSYLSIKLYSTQQDLIACKSLNIDLKNSLDSQNKKILDFQNKLDKKDLNNKEKEIEARNKSLIKEINSCSDVLFNYLKMYKEERK